MIVMSSPGIIASHFKYDNKTVSLQINSEFISNAPNEVPYSSSVLSVQESHTLSYGFHDIIEVWLEISFC